MGANFLSKTAAKKKKTQEANCKFRKGILFNIRIQQKFDYVRLKTNTDTNGHIYSHLKKNEQDIKIFLH